MGVSSGSPPGDTPRRFGRRQGMVAVLVALLGGVVYLNALRNPFVFDDHRLIIENRSLADLSDVPAIVWRDVTRPLINLSYAVDRAIWGASPVGFHLTNVLLHMVNIVLVFAMAWALAQDRAPRNGGVIGSDVRSSDAVATVTALLFAVHPMMSQAVGYISGRSEVACATFVLAAFLAARQWMVVARTRWLVVAIASFVVALSAREVTTMLPFTLLAYDRMVRFDDDARRRRRLLTFHLPAIALTLIAGLARVWVLLRVEYAAEGVDPGLTLVAVDAIRRYLGLLLVPFGQTIFHALPPIDSVFESRAFVAIGSLGILVGAIWWFRRFDRIMAFGLIWFVLLLVPSSALFALGRGEALAEHRVYSASIGVFLAAGSLVGWLGARVERQRPRAQWLVYGLFTVLVLDLAVRTVVRNAMWSSPVALWTEAVEKAPDHWLPRLMLAEALREGRGCGLAEPEYRRAMTLRPQEPFTYKKLGGCLVELNRVDEANEAFARLREVDPRSSDGSTGLAIVAMMRGRPDDARTYLQEALSREPSTVLARQLLVTLEEPTNPSEALGLCREIQTLAPETAGNDECIRRNQTRVDAAVRP